MTFKKSLTVFVVLIFMTTLFLQICVQYPQKANADTILSDNIMCSEEDNLIEIEEVLFNNLNDDIFDNIYYFSDVQPTRMNALINYCGGYYNNLVYETYFMNSAQDLAFLLYSGYFYQKTASEYYSEYNLAIIELVTIYAPAQLINQIVEFFHSIDYKVMFISPCADSYSAANSNELSCDVLLKCNIDRYPTLLYLTFKNLYGMYYHTYPYCWDLQDLTLILDSRILGINQILNYVNFEQLCYDNLLLQKTILCLYYAGFFHYNNLQALENYEIDLYADIWDLYTNTFIDIVSSNHPAYYYASFCSVYSVMGFWPNLKEWFDENPEDYEWRVEYFEEEVEALTKEYYRNLADELYTNNVKILLSTCAYIETENNHYDTFDCYFDLFTNYLDENDNIINYYTILNHDALYNAFNVGDIVSICKYQYKQNVYNLLMNIYINLSHIRIDHDINLNIFLNYLWDDTGIPLEYLEDIEFPVITSDDLLAHLQRVSEEYLDSLFCMILQNIMASF